VSYTALFDEPIIRSFPSLVLENRKELSFEFQNATERDYCAMQGGKSLEHSRS
jgi:hypothetical protein